MARDQDIGRVEADPVTVRRIEDVITASNELKHELEALTAKVESLRIGQELILGQEVSE